MTSDLQLIPTPLPGEMLNQHINMLIDTVNVLIHRDETTQKVCMDQYTMIGKSNHRIGELQNQINALSNSLNTDQDRRFILDLHISKVIDRDECRVMLGLPAGERRNPAPFTKEDLDALTNERVKDNADCIMDCLEQAIEDGELPVDIGAIE